MREIKFRVWTGIEMVYDVMVGKFGIFYVNPNNNGLDENDSASLSPYNTKYFDDIPLMLFTGFKDRNGKEIYEGDIISFYTNSLNGTKVFDVGWNGLGFCFEPYNINVWKFGEFVENYEIIGNIYSNPELVDKCIKKS